MQEYILLGFLLVASALVSTGVFLIYMPAGFIVAGVLVAVVALLYLLDVGSSQ